MSVTATLKSFFVRDLGTISTSKNSNAGVEMLGPGLLSFPDDKAARRKLRTGPSWKETWDFPAYSGLHEIV